MRFGDRQAYLTLPDGRRSMVEEISLKGDILLVRFVAKQEKGFIRQAVDYAGMRSGGTSEHSTLVFGFDYFVNRYSLEVEHMTYRQQKSLVSMLSGRTK